MEPQYLREYLEKLFDGHGVSYQISNEWVLPYGQLPAVRATWFPREKNGVFEVEVLLEDKRLVNECFAGVGAEEKGILSGLENFCVNSFHVLLAAFWKIHEPDQVTTEEWDINGKVYKAYIGNFGTRATNGIEPKIPDHLFSTVEQVVQADGLTRRGLTPVLARQV